MSLKKDSEVCTLQEALAMCGFGQLQCADAMVVKPTVPVRIRVNHNGTFWCMLGTSPTLTGFMRVLPGNPGIFPWYTTCYGFCVVLDKDDNDNPILRVLSSGGN